MTPPPPKQGSILKSYLSGSMITLLDLSDPVVRLGLQVFILGMTDMLRQVEELSWEQFIAIYEATLAEHKLLPSMPLKNFVVGIGERASSDGDVEKVMRHGAQSIQMYMAENDADAPIDLNSAANFAEMNAGSFSPITDKSVGIPSNGGVSATRRSTSTETAHATDDPSSSHRPVPSLIEFESAERVFSEYILGPLGINVDDLDYQASRDISQSVFVRLLPLRDEFVGACIGIPHATLTPEAISFPKRFLKIKHSINQLNRLRELVEISFDLGLLYHLFYVANPTRAAFDRVDAGKLRATWIIEALVADMLSKDYDAGQSGIPSGLQDKLYRDRIEPYLKGWGLSWWTRVKAKSWFKNPFFAGIRLGMAVDSATSRFANAEGQRSR